MREGALSRAALAAVAPELAEEPAGEDEAAAAEGAGGDGPP